MGQDGTRLSKSLQLKPEHFTGVALVLSHAFVWYDLAPSIIGPDRARHQVAQLDIEGIEVVHAILQVDGHVMLAKVEGLLHVLPEVMMVLLLMHLWLLASPLVEELDNFLNQLKGRDHVL